MGDQGRPQGSYSTERPGYEQPQREAEEEEEEGEEKEEKQQKQQEEEEEEETETETETEEEELDSVAIMALLRRFVSENPFLQAGDWDARLVSHLESIMDTVAFLDYEEIMQAGEHATWVGLVLDGACAVLIEGKRVATLQHGSLVGEMSLFTGLKRNADVISASRSTKIGVIRFDVLDNLWSERPRLVVALMTAMGSAAVHKSGVNAARQAQAASEQLLSSLLNGGGGGDGNGNGGDVDGQDDTLRTGRSTATTKGRASSGLRSPPASPPGTSRTQAKTSRAASSKWKSSARKLSAARGLSRKDSSTRVLTSQRLAPEEAAEQEIIYRAKFVDLRRSEKRHKKARDEARKKASKQVQKRKRERLTFQARERYVLFPFLFVSRSFLIFFFSPPLPASSPPHPTHKRRHTTQHGPMNKTKTKKTPLTPMRLRQRVCREGRGHAPTTPRSRRQERAARGKHARAENAGRGHDSAPAAGAARGPAQARGQVQDAAQDGPNAAR